MRLEAMFGGHGTSAQTHIPTLKHGGSIMLWGCLVVRGASNNYHLEGDEYFYTYFTLYSFN